MGDSELAVETTGLAKRYGDRLAVDHLDMSVRRGEVYGFVGPNGAGKTTTMRMLVGLIRPTSGTGRLLGHEIGDHRGLDSVGAMIEAPAFYPYLSGRDNLRVAARYARVRSARVDEVLERVGLRDRAGDRFSAYSTGMKQRLGVAAALLKDPQLLILDEPANGLDPAGIVDMRRLISGLAAEGRTVMLSSHLLTDLEGICHRVGIIGSGRLVAEDQVSRLRGVVGVRMRAEPIEEARRLLEALPDVRDVSLDGGALIVRADPAMAVELNRALISAGVAVSEIAPVERSLEEAFFELVGEGPRVADGSDPDASAVP